MTIQAEKVEAEDTAPQMPTNGCSFNVVLDVWGGEFSQTHVARSMLSVDLAGMRCVFAALAVFVSMAVVTYGHLPTIGWVWMTGLVTGCAVSVLLGLKPKTLEN